MAKPLKSENDVDEICLTEKERSVLGMTIKGWMNKRIAGILDCSEKTIEHHQTALHEKFGVSCRAELILKALKIGYGEDASSGPASQAGKRRYEKLRKMESDEFHQLTGMKPEAFSSMLSALEGKRTNAGRPANLSLEDQLLLTLLRRRNHASLKRLSEEFDISEATACRIIRRIESLLKKSDDPPIPAEEPSPDLCKKIEGNP